MWHIQRNIFFLFFHGKGICHDLLSWSLLALHTHKHFPSFRSGAKSLGKGLGLVVALSFRSFKKRSKEWSLSFLIACSRILAACKVFRIQNTFDGIVSFLVTYFLILLDIWGCIKSPSPTHQKKEETALAFEKRVNLFPSLFSVGGFFIPPWSFFGSLLRFGTKRKKNFLLEDVFFSWCSSIVAMAEIDRERPSTFPKKIEEKNLE